VCLIRRLVTAAGGTGIHKLLGVILQRGPPEPLQKAVPGPLDLRWQVNLEAWAHISTLDLRSGGTNL